MFSVERVVFEMCAPPPPPNILPRLFLLLLLPPPLPPPLPRAPPPHLSLQPGLAPRVLHRDYTTSNISVFIKIPLSETADDELN